MVFTSFQQNLEEFNSLDYFPQDHVKFFDPITVKQVRDVVFVKEKTTSLSELFSVELKFTRDTLVKQCNGIFKSKFLELNDIQKQMFVKKIQ